MQAPCSGTAGPIRAIEAIPRDGDRDDLATAKGIIAGALLSIPLWGAIELLAWYFLSP